MFSFHSSIVLTGKSDDSRMDIMYEKEKMKRNTGEKMKKENVVDMTQGAILPQLIRFMLPVFAGLICQRVYNFADCYIVGHYLGDNALSAVSISGTATYLLTSLMIGLTTGVSVVMAQNFGAKRMDRVEDTFVSSIYVALGFTIIITVVGLLVSTPLLKVLQTPEEVLGEAILYLKIIFAGSIATMLYNWISAVLRSLGNSVVPLIFLIISSGLNIFLDLVLVAWIPLGVAGAAIATVAAQLVSGLVCLFFAFRLFPFLKVKREKWGLDRALGMEILKYGIPAGAQMSIISISDMFLQGYVNTYGTDMVVAYGVCTKVEALGMQWGDAIGSAVATFVGQNVGAENYKRVKQGFRCAFFLNLAGYLVISPIIYLFSGNIMRMFTANEAAIAYGVEYMHIFGPFLLGVGILILFHNLLRSSGDILVTIMMGVSEVVTRITFSILFSFLWGYAGLWWVSPLTWWIAAGVGAVRYISGKWKKPKETL